MANSGVKRAGVVDFIRPIDGVAANIAPIPRFTPDQTIAVGEPFSIFALSSEDPDGDNAALTLSATLTSQPSGSAVTLTNVKRGHWTFTPTHNGAYVVVGSASDGFAVASQTRTYTASGAAPPPTSVKGEPGTTGTYSTIPSGVLFVGSYETTDWQSRHGVGSNNFSSGNLSIADYGLGLGKSARVRHVANTNKGVDYHAEFSRAGFGPSYDELYFGYVVRFPSDFQWTNPTGGGHGKLPGLAGVQAGVSDWKVGHGGVRYNGETAITGTTSTDLQTATGWSLRMLFGKDAGLKTYLYAPSPTGVVSGSKVYGHARTVNQSIGGSAFRFQRGVNHWIVQWVKMNTPGVADGELKVWVDDSLGLHQTGIMFRGPNRSGVKISQQFFSCFFGGGSADAPASAQYTYFDNPVISTQYPPRPGGTAPPPPPSPDSGVRTLDLSKGEQEMGSPYKTGSPNSRGSLYRGTIGGRTDTFWRVYNPGSSMWGTAWLCAFDSMLTPIPASDELVFAYDVYHPANWQNSVMAPAERKAPSLGGYTSSVTRIGDVDRDSSGQQYHRNDQFGAGMMLMAKSNNRQGGLGYLNVWKYNGVLHNDQTGTYPGDITSFYSGLRWRNPVGSSTDAYLTIGGWSTSQERVVMNTPGVDNGTIEYYVGTTLVARSNRVGYRNASYPHLRINAWSPRHFWGGPSSAYPTSSLYVYFDNFRFAKELIT